MRSPKSFQPGPSPSRRTSEAIMTRSFSMSLTRVVRVTLIALLGVGSGAANAAFVYETGAEFLTAGDFNGDGVVDVLVLDKLTGNARVGYADTSGVLTWSAPLVTGVENASGCTVGRLLQTTRDAVAATSAGLNRVNLVDLSNTNTAGTPVIVTPAGLGPHMLVTLANPLGGVPPAYNYLLAASSLNNAPAERLDLMSISAGIATRSEERRVGKE